MHSVGGVHGFVSVGTQSEGGVHGFVGDGMSPRTHPPGGVSGLSTHVGAQSEGGVHGLAAVGTQSDGGGAACSRCGPGWLRPMPWLPSHS